MTLVGDFGQASRAGAARGWSEVLRLLPKFDAPREITLTVNYRTPSEIMDVANRLLTVAAPGVEPSRSVRSTGAVPRFVRTGGALVDTVADHARRAVSSGGTVAVIAPGATHAELVERLAEVGAVADSPEALDAPIAVLDPLEAKGLEFDHVIVVEPAELVPPGPAGLRTLYVSLTRATQTLTVIHRAPLPEALAS
jgi:DNA helicase IV